MKPHGFQNGHHFFHIGRKIARLINRQRIGKVLFERFCFYRFRHWVIFSQMIFCTF